MRLIKSLIMMESNSQLSKAPQLQCKQFENQSTSKYQQRVEISCCEHMLEFLLSCSKYLQSVRKLKVRFFPFLHPLFDEHKWKKYEDKYLMEKFINKAVNGEKSLICRANSFPVFRRGVYDNWRWKGWQNLPQAFNSCLRRYRAQSTQM